MRTYCDECSPVLHQFNFQPFARPHISVYGGIFGHRAPTGTHRSSETSSNDKEDKIPHSHEYHVLTDVFGCQLLSVEVGSALAKIQLCLVVTSNRTHSGCGFRVRLIFFHWCPKIHFNYIRRRQKSQRNQEIQFRRHKFWTKNSEKNSKNEQNQLRSK